MKKMTYEDVCKKIDVEMKEKRNALLDYTMIWSFYITDNEGYDPERFSEEIEKDLNSRDWSMNHTKKCPVKLKQCRMMKPDFDAGLGRWRRPENYAYEMKRTFRQIIEKENVYGIWI